MQVLAHNMAAQFANRQLNITTKDKARSSEKLSSGYRINRSADDAAGLQISEKLRWQVRGLNKASNNIEDGISLIRVADGALNETHAVLQRMRELSVQAANDTNTDADRAAIQSEIDLLSEEVDRIAKDTSFNSKIYPLLGTEGANEIVGGEWKLPDCLFECHVKGEVYHHGCVIDGVEYNLGDMASGDVICIDGSKLDNPSVQIIGASFILISNGSIYIPGSDNNFDNLINNYGGFESESFTSLKMDDLKIDDDGYIYYVGTNGYNTYIKLGDVNSPGFGTPTIRNEYCLRATRVSDIDGVNGSDSLWIQMGAQSNQGMFLSLVNATAKGVGITDPALDIMSHENAGTSISRLDDAISKVSGYRSNFGAQQNRLEYAKSVDDNTAENSQAAESRIRDTDMAEGMVEYSKHNILEQAGQSMLAQAKLSKQGILNLLQ